MDDSADILDLLIAISRLPEDKPRCTPGKWYLTQKEHWIGWLFEYNSPGAYRRKATSGRDARFVYNHVVQPEMLVYLAEAAGVDRTSVARAKRVLSSDATLMQKAAQIRELIPWPVVAAALWPDGI